ncbi:MAG TPA: ABC transporter ATP-binding protein [Candidatus Methylacidiphilales bacterium]
MSALPIIEVANLGKSYRLGEIGMTTFREGLSRWWRGEGKSAAPARVTSRHEGDVFHALDDVSFAVPEGQVLGLIGPNGAGKSTLLKILSKITRPSRGTVTLRGRCASLLEVGTGFHPDLTGRENVYLNGTLLGMTVGEVRRKFDEIVAFSGIEAFVDTPVKRYSSGMYVRLAFAVAAHLEPEILVVDEVLAVGDAAFQTKCLGKMQEVGRSGRTVLFVSHNMAAIKELTQRCLVLSGGKIAFDGPAEAAADFYLKEGRSAAAWEADLDAIPREDLMGPDNGKYWRFTRVRLAHGEDGLRDRAPLEIELDYHSLRDQEEISVGLHVADLYGTRLITCRSLDNPGGKVACRAGERGTFRVTIPAPCLPPGVYQLKVHALSGLQVFLDLLPEAMRFEVSATPESDYWAQTFRNEGLRLPSRWERLSHGRGGA